MQHAASHTLPLDALAELRQAAQLAGQTAVPVQCRCGWDADGALVLALTDPRELDSAVVLAGGVPEQSCAGCGRDVADDTVVSVALRDRHGRCARALALESAA